ncbi:hypothetical protein B0H10DRAFT_1944910 [Mycena sp. CBHHK59/15]|nr:hypothetical protein B0H10DRAFT_1944910 [Mycena sp. CBHHK59/15]
MRTRVLARIWKVCAGAGPPHRDVANQQESQLKTERTQLDSGRRTAIRGSASEAAVHGATKDIECDSFGDEAVTRVLINQISLYGAALASEGQPEVGQKTARSSTARNMQIPDSFGPSDHTENPASKTAINKQQTHARPRRETCSELASLQTPTPAPSLWSMT